MGPTDTKSKTNGSRSNATDSIEKRTLPAVPVESFTRWETDNIKAKHRSHAKIQSLGDFENLPPFHCMESTIINDEFVNKTYSQLWTQREYLAPAIVYNLEGQSQDIEVIYLPKLRLSEAEFFKLVSKDDVQAVEKFFQEHPEFDVNCVNFQGITALHIAVQNRSEAMLEFLLQQRNIEIGDTVLSAIRDNNINILVTLLDALKKVSPGLEFAGATHSTMYPGYVTPLILATQLENYEIVNLLISRGHTINHPHHPNCRCSKCKLSVSHEDPLYSSGARLASYKAISSPVYLVHITSDPILAAFQLTAELNRNAKSYMQVEAEYLQLEDKVSAFAVDLIGQNIATQDNWFSFAPNCLCRTSQEVELILKQPAGGGKRYFVLPRLLMAVEYKQKGFVAHPNTQQVLHSHWLEDWHSWKTKSFLSRISTFVGRIFITPVILLMCMIAPRHRLVKHWQIPLNKLITHAAAYFVFLALIFYISNQDRSKQKRGPPNTGAEAPVMLYVCGYMWSAIRMCLMQGPRRYFNAMWNWFELLMLILFGVTFMLWVLAALDVAVNDDEFTERKLWSQYDMTLLSEGTFCLATIFAYFRLMLFCQLDYHLGPLQVCLGKMTYDIYKYIIVFAIIISAFAAGLARFYQYYDGMVYEDEFGMKTMQVSSFTSLTDTLNTLFWALFCMAPLESADVVLENTRTVKHADKDNKHAFTERIGYFCFGCFEVISVIVVLNMLIATMSNTFQRVTDNVAVEWTFGRTRVYVDFMHQTTLPSPYNMVPTAAAMSSVFEWLRTKLCKTSGARAKWSPSLCCYVERDIEASLQKEYPALMSVLVQRYFRRKLAQNQQKLAAARLHD